jgi:hypothetical protein
MLTLLGLCAAVPQRLSPRDLTSFLRTQEHDFLKVIMLVRISSLIDSAYFSMPPSRIRSSNKA